MRNKEYFLITVLNNKYLVLANDSIEAVNLWYESRRKALEEEGRKMISKPSNFTVEKVAYESELIQASE